MPDRRRYVKVDVISGSLCSHVQMGRREKEDVRGPGKGAKIGQLTLSMGPVKSASSYKEPPFQVRVFSASFSKIG